MEVKAHLRNLRIAPRKVRLVVDLVRGKSVKEAQRQLKFNQRRAALPVLKLINSAVANASHNFNVDTDTLVIKMIRVNEGTTLKRWQPRAFGRAGMIRKRSSHIEVVLEGQQKIKASQPKANQESAKQEKSVVLKKSVRKQAVKKKVGKKAKKEVNA